MDVETRRLPRCICSKVCSRQSLLSLQLMSRN